MIDIKIIKRSFWLTALKRAHFFEIIYEKAVILRALLIPFFFLSYSGDEGFSAIIER